MLGVAEKTTTTRIPGVNLTAGGILGDAEETLAADLAVKI